MQTTSNKTPLLRVLLVDDDTTDNFLHQRVLKRSDAVDQIVTFEHPEEAIDYLNQGDEEFDVVFLDINMPKINGFEFLALLEGMKRPNLSESLVVMLSTSVDSEDLGHAQRIWPYVDVIRKPLEKDKFDSLIQKHFDSISLMRQE